jgi:predicted nucleic acid-binding protein
MCAGSSPARGAPARILQHWQDARVDVVVSSAILVELDWVLHHPKLQGRYHLSEKDVQTFLQSLKRQAVRVAPTAALAMIQSDPTDNRYAECEAAGGPASSSAATRTFSNGMNSRAFRS